MREEFIAAEDLLKKADLLEAKLPVPLDSVIEYLAKDGLELYYYDPKEAPELVKDAAHGVDEVLHRKDGTATLFVNRNRPRVRQRFSLCHGIGHFILPSHRNLNYLILAKKKRRESPILEVEILRTTDSTEPQPLEEAKLAKARPPRRNTEGEAE